MHAVTGVTLYLLLFDIFAGTLSCSTQCILCTGSGVRSRSKIWPQRNTDYRHGTKSPALQRTLDRLDASFKLACLEAVSERRACVVKSAHGPEFRPYPGRRQETLHTFSEKTKTLRIRTKV